MCPSLRNVRKLRSDTAQMVKVAYLNNMTVHGMSVRDMVAQTHLTLGILLHEGISRPMGQPN